MSRTRTLLWKEWHEVRVFLAIALFVFAGLPVIGALEDRIHRFSASLWVFLLGGLLAVLVGVGTVSRDLNGRLEDFWRSRPVSVVRWILVKYFVGLGVVLVVLTVPLAAEIVLNQGKSVVGTDPRFILAWNPFLWAAGYSAAFAVACLVRRAAQAAIVAIAALLSLYFLPYVLPPIQFLGLGWVMDASEFPRTDSAAHVLSIYHQVPWMPWRALYEPRQLLFVLGMIVLSAAGLALAVVAVKRDWHIESGRKLTYWSIGGVILLILCSAASEVGTNLPVLQKLDLPENTHVVSIQSDGSLGAMVTWTDAIDGPSKHLVQSIRLTSAGVEFGPALPIKDNLYTDLWLPEHPDYLYVAGLGDRASDSNGNYPTLSVVDLRGPVAQTETQSFPDGAWDRWVGQRLYSWNHRLYLLASKCLTFDLSDPRKPHLISIEPINWHTPPMTPSEKSFLWDRAGEPEAGTIRFPDIPGLPPRQRLELFLGPRGELFDGDILTRTDGGRLTTYHLDQLTDHSATFHRLGRYEPTSLESLYESGVPQFAQKGGLLFESFGPAQLDEPHLTVFSIDGPRPEPIGHFAVPNEQPFRILCPLPDGRVFLAAGEHRLYLLGPPPRK